MLGVIACLAGVLVILATAELLWRRRILRGELQRKFVHIIGGTFVAFWPWLTSWRAIQLIGLGLLTGAVLNRYKKTLHFRGEVQRQSYGDIFSALAIVLAASLTTKPIFFAIAILHLSLADGLAAVVGTRYGKHWEYKVFAQTKSVVGSMTFWFVSVCILGTGVLFVNDLIDFESYLVLLVVLPPILTALENLAILGSDNIVIPVAVLIALNLMS